MTEQKKSNRVFFIILILALLVVNGLILFSSLKNKREKQQLSADLAISDSLRNDFQMRYEDALVELEDVKGQNAEKDEQIEEYITQLKESKRKIDRQLAARNLSNKEKAELTKQLDNAKAEISALMAEKDAFLQQIGQLKEENVVLTQNLEVKISEVKNLTEENTDLKDEKDSLYNIGSILKASNISFSTIKVKRNNKERKTTRAKKVDKISVCFDLDPNKISPSGKKNITMKIVSPSGATLFSRAQGSGSFENMESAKSESFTKSFAVDYVKGELKNYCTRWEQADGFEKGNYGVELFQSGYLIGQGGFVLK